jgi:hypothetical protein
MFVRLDRYPLKRLVLVLPEAFIEIGSIFAVLVDEDVRICQDIAALSDQESRTLRARTNHVPDRLPQLRHLWRGQAKLRSLHAQQTARINPLAVGIPVPDQIDLSKNAPRASVPMESERRLWFFI